MGFDLVSWWYVDMSFLAYSVLLKTMFWISTKSTLLSILLMTLSSCYNLLLLVVFFEKKKKNRKLPLKGSRASFYGFLFSGEMTHVARGTCPSLRVLYSNTAIDGSE